LFGRWQGYTVCTGGIIPAQAGHFKTKPRTGKFTHPQVRDWSVTSFDTPDRSLYTPRGRNGCRRRHERDEAAFLLSESGPYTLRSR